MLHYHCNILNINNKSKAQNEVCLLNRRLGQLDPHLVFYGFCQKISNLSENLTRDTNNSIPVFKIQRR